MRTIRVSHCSQSYSGIDEFANTLSAEHVFEGQIIGDFFSEWLDKGQVRKQNPVPPNPTPKVPCSWTREWIRAKKTNPAWTIKKHKSAPVRASFAEVLLSELGSEEHMDRLTIFLSRPNRKKGNVSYCYFHNYTTMSCDPFPQLLHLRCN